MQRLFITILTLFLLSACAPDPRNQADADKTRLQAEQNAADQAQAREQNKVAFDLKQKQAEQQSAEWVKSWTQYMTLSMFFATLATCAALLALGIGFSWASIGTGQAIAKAASVKANLIYLDPKTRAYPLFLQHIGRGRFTLTDMTTGQVKELDTRDPGDQALIAGVNSARLAGAVAFEARHHKNPQEVYLTANNASRLIEVKNA
jgi:hypothetical protein